MPMISLAAAVLALLAPAPVHSAPPARAVTRANVAYGAYSGLSLLMDVMTPPHPSGRAVLLIPGSGWQAPIGMAPFAIKDGQQAVQQPLLDAGFTVFTVDHRAAPRFRWPDPLLDVQRAARFIRAHAAEFGVRADWLGLVGGSSGGHLASMLALVGEGSEAGLDEPAGAPRAQCVVAVMTPSDLLPLGQDGWGVALATQFVGTTAPFPDEAAFPGYRERLQPWLDASPVAHLGHPRARFLLIHGDADKLVPVAQSIAFRQKLTAAGAAVELRIMPGVGHAFPAPYPAGAAVWLKDCLARTAKP